MLGMMPNIIDLPTGAGGAVQDTSGLIQSMEKAEKEEPKKATGWFTTLLSELIKATPGTISAIKGTTPATTTDTSKTSNGTVTGNVTIDSVLSQLGFKPTISGVTVDIPKWVYLVMIAAGIMLFFPFLKSLKRRR